MRLNGLRALNRIMLLPDGDRWLLVEAALYLGCARLAIATTTPRTLLALGRLPEQRCAALSASSELPLELAEIVHVIERTSVRLPFANCLVRAVGLRMMLTRRNLPTELHIGVRKDETGQFAAHAWLTFRDTVLIGGIDAPHLYRELVGSAHTLLQ